MTDWSNLWAIFSWVCAGPGAGWAAYQIMNRITWGATVTMEAKRFISIGITCGLAVAAWLILVLVGKQALPIGAVGWVEQAFAVAGTAYIVNQGIHGATNLREADKAAAKEVTESAAMDKADCDCAGSCTCPK